MAGSKIEPSIPIRSIPDPALLSYPMEQPMDSPEFAELKGRVRVLEAQIAENTELTGRAMGLLEKLVIDTGGMVEFTRNAQGALNTANWLIKMLKPIGYLGFIIGGIWAVMTLGKAWIISAIQSGTIR